METLITYLLKVSIAIALFYGLHMLFLRNETFLKLRRAYFLIALVFSLSFPFVNLHWEVSQKSELPLPAYVMSEIEVFVGGQNTTFSFGEMENLLSFSHLLIAIAAMGALVLLARFFVQLASLFVQLRRMKSKEFNGCKVVAIEDASVPSFSFFRWIVINTSNAHENQILDIVAHEEAHSHQLHSLDVMLYELFCIVFWWNPFAWLLKKEMKLNLEYLADAAVQNSKADFKEYQYTLLQISIANTGMAFINNFNVSQLKKRITMMNKKRSSIVWSGKFLLAFPLALALVLGNVVYAAPTLANDDDNPKVSKLEPATKKDVFTIVEEMPKFPGGEAEMMKFIGQNLRYPLDAQKAGAQGRVVVRFVVDELGTIKDAEIVRNGVELKNELDEIVVVGFSPEGDKTESKLSLAEVQKVIDDESIRVVEAMPNWEPGKQGGKVVPVYFTLPILFRLR